MEFWGVEVKPGETLKVKPELFKIIHISQAALGEFKKAKGSATVPLRLKINEKSFIMGSLSTEDRPQMMVDLVFEKEFELSHDWKNGSVHFVGYTADDGSPEFSDDEEISSDEDGEGMTNDFPVKGPSQIKDASLDSDESGDSDAEDDSTDMSSSDDEPLPEDDALENSSSDDEPSKKKQSKKRPQETVAVLPSVTKKPKLPAPQKAGGKNGQAGKGPSPNNKSKAKNGKAPFQKRRA